MNSATFRIFVRILLALPLLAALPACVPVVVVGAGAATGALVAEDRRSPGIQLEDQNIELKTGNRISDKHQDLVHINVTSFDRNVLLTGEAPTAAVKADIERIASGVENVRGVVNEIQVAGVSSLGTRANDAFLTSKVKASFVSAQKFYANHVKVVTESNVVYLMGMVTRQEADEATEIARNVGGVQKVIRVFEYVVKVDKPADKPAPPPEPQKQ
jgi:osmotically-inducible protein OsmY